MKKVCVIGLGYIGLPTSIVLSTNGYQVIGVDINHKLLGKINSKEAPFEEIGLQEKLEEAIDSKRLKVQDKPEVADVFIIAVPSPITEEKTADVSYIEKATTSILPFLRKGNLVILESTVPPLTVEKVMIPILEKSTLKIGEELYVSHCPERVLPGKIFQELVYNDRIIGGINQESTNLTKEIYGTFVKGKIHTTDCTTAEMVKVMENTYRDVNIAFANELAKIAESINVDIWEAIQLANLHPRVNIHQPGPGVGGHCIAVDPYFLVEINKDQSKLIQTSRKINEEMPEYVVDRVKKIFPLEKAKDINIALLGLAYKGNVDDIRESPALEVKKNLEIEGYNVSLFDPLVSEMYFDNQKRTIEEAVDASDLIIIVTDHNQFKDMNPKSLINSVRKKMIFDTKNCISYEKWKEQGFEVFRLGSSDTVGNR